VNTALSENDRQEFITAMVEAGALLFGEFTTKSGRQTPYFINMGMFQSGAHLKLLGRLYAQAILDIAGKDFDVLFGPAYKGIPLVTATAIALCDHAGITKPILYNRKERKDHGERGNLVGHTLRDGDRIIIIEDVTTAGTSIHETVPLLRAQADVSLTALIVAVDRKEKSPSGRGGLQEIGTHYGLKTASLCTIDDIVSFLFNRSLNGTVYVTEERKHKIDMYREKYGV